MYKKLSPHLQAKIETLCESGCQRVNQVIEQLETQGSIEETRELSDEDCQLLLQELKNIMSVYDK